jgi:hypothetical protein
MARYNKQADRRQQERKEALRLDKIVKEKYGSWTYMHYLEINANSKGKLFYRGLEK